MRNLTITDEEVETIKELLGLNKSREEIAKALGINYGKLYNNMRVLGLIKPMQQRSENFDKNGMFDFDKFFAHYKY